MLVCEEPELVRWQPNFSSSVQASPLWTRLVCDGLEICNTMEGSHWADPRLVQVIVCEECGHPGCATADIYSSAPLLLDQNLTMANHSSRARGSLIVRATSLLVRSAHPSASR